MRHRYIFCGVVNGTDKVSSFRLISNITKYSLGHCVRVNIPDNMELDYFPGDGYNTVSEDERTLDEVGWDCYFLFKGKWRKFNYLKQFWPCYWSSVLEYIFGLYDCDDEIGWTDDVEVYKKYLNDGYRGKVPFKCSNEAKYPPFKEDKKELELPINIQEWPFEHIPDENWFKVYEELKNK